MKAFKEGGTPGFVQTQESSPVPSERLIGGSPLAFTPNISIKTSSVPSVAQRPQAASPSGPAPIETYASDFSARLKETQASPVTVLAAEQDEGVRQVQMMLREPEHGNRWYIAGGMLLVLLGGVGIYFAYSRYLAVVTPVVVAPITSTPIFVDSQEQVRGIGIVLAQAVEQSVDKPLALNTVKLLTTGTSTDSSGSIFSALAARAPGLLTRNVDAMGSMTGVVSVEVGNTREQSPFFILSVTSYGAAFSGMLSWESTMQSDLNVLFSLYPMPTVAATTTAAISTSSTRVRAGQIIPKATTTPAVATTTTAQAPKGGFRDEVVSNHDVRVYRDASGRSIMLYGFWNQAILVIARSPEAFAEILARLATSHAQ